MAITAKDWGRVVCRKEALERPMTLLGGNEDGTLICCYFDKDDQYHEETVKAGDLDFYEHRTN